MEGQIREKIKSIAQEIMTLKFICAWIFSQNADNHDYVNLKLVAPVGVWHINTNNSNLSEQSKPTILTDLSSYIKENILTLQGIRNSIWSSVFNILQAIRKLLSARIRSGWNKISQITGKKIIQK